MEGMGEGVNTGSGGQTISEARAPSRQVWTGVIGGRGDGVVMRHVASRSRATCSGSYEGLVGHVMGRPLSLKSGMGGSRFPGKGSA